MSTPIPGSNVIGWGFNIFGTYSSASRTQQLFAMRDEGKYWTYGPTDYLVPENLSVEATSESTGQSYVFENRTEVEQFFSVKANVKGSYGAFSGEFEASYEQRNVSDTDYIYAMYQLSHHSWRLDLLDRTQTALAPWVVGDPDWQVPATFDQSTASRFYRFFEKYGTHFVSSVQVGYRLYFSQAVKRSYESNEQTIKS
ncbi:MAG: MAC/perforin domain-containing protein, partial [Kofleriaceae bacterium]